MARYFRPNSLPETLDLLRSQPLTVLAGGTDHYPARVGQPLDDDLLDISGLTALRGIEEQADHWRIGALTTWSEIRGAPLPAWFDGLKLAAREVGGIQIQNAGTIGGNLCNASPAADGVPPLLALDAEVELIAHDREVRRPLSAFLLGNRHTTRQADELLSAILVPKPKARCAASHFRKLGARRYLVISIVMVGASLEVAEDGTVEQARIAVGACSPTAKRLPAAEAALRGAPCDQPLAQLVRPEYLADLRPIDDARASASYRLDAALMLVQRTLAELASRS